MNLFEIDANIRAFLDGLYATADEDGTVEADFEQLEALNAQRDKKWENIALYIKETETEAAALKAEAKKLNERARVADNKAKRLRDYLAGSMQRNQAKEFKTARCALSFRRSKGVVIPDEAQLAKKYLVATYKPDKAGIKKLLEEGHKVKGAYLEDRQTIQIK